ncbi:MAG: BrxE family protein [Gemmataceae bacterium]
MTAETDVTSSRHSKIVTLATARILVAYLGERAQCGWWPTSFFTATGLKFLEYNFPRTIISAAVHSVCHTAKQLHDKRIGKAGSYHLFRLPHEIEQDLHAVILEATNDTFSQLFSNQQAALEGLDQLANGDSSEAVGPVRVAGINQLTTRPALRKMAAYYRSAFRSHTQAFPYFTIE